MPWSSWIESLTERLAVALASAFAATLTLALYPVALIILGHGGGGGEFELGADFYSFMFWKVGLAVVIASSIAGFCLGPERMANVFSFFWGTHSFWTNLDAYLDENLSEWQSDHNVPLWLLIILLVILAIVILKNL